MDEMQGPHPLSLFEAAENLLTISNRIGKPGFDMRGVLDDYEIAKDQLADAVEMEKKKMADRRENEAYQELFDIANHWFNEQSSQVKTLQSLLAKDKLPPREGRDTSIPYDPSRPYGHNTSPHLRDWIKYYRSLLPTYSGSDLNVMSEAIDKMNEELQRREK